MSNEAPIVAYVIYGCPYCKAAVKLLRSLGVPHRIQNIGSNADLMVKLANATGSPTVPKIFVNGEFIGGYTNLEQLAKSGQLDQFRR
jgi:glutaredoxin